MPLSCRLLPGEKEYVASAKSFVSVASANEIRCGDNFNCYNNNMNFTTTIKVVTVTSKIVTPTILVC